MKEYLETVYEHFYGDDYMTISACERWSIGMVKRLKKRFPDDVHIVVENKDGTIMARVPFSWMRVLPKKTKNKKS